MKRDPISGAPEHDGQVVSSRRGFFGFLAGAAAAAHVPKAWLPAPVARAMPVSPLMAELNAITRKAFVPRIAAQIYTQHPMLSMTRPGGRLEAVTITNPGTGYTSAIAFDWNGYDKEMT